MERHGRRSSGFRERDVIEGFVIIEHDFGKSGPSNSASLHFYSRNVLDPKTGKGKKSEKARLKGGKCKRNSDGSKTTSYKIKFKVEIGFGIPAALEITNQHSHKFFLKFVSLQIHDYSQFVYFDCNFWVYPNTLAPTPRLFFSNTSCVPRETGEGLIELRREELRKIRGDIDDEFNDFESIYDYQLHSPSSSLPYPLRATTVISSSPNNETVCLEKLVPRDERLSRSKLRELAFNSVKAAIHFLIPTLKTLQNQPSHFNSFSELHRIFVAKHSLNLAEEEWAKQKIKKFLPHFLFREIFSSPLRVRENLLKFPLPQIVEENELAWKDDDEFARQMLAGSNPVRIKCLQKFPVESKKGGVSTIKASDIEHNLHGLTLQQAIMERRIFILDHHDYLMSFLNRINKNGVFAYASRTLVFLKSDSTLKPLAIELSLPYSDNGEEEISWVYLPATQGMEAALWVLAKAHVAANDSVYHQLISHWLHTHAVVEPFIIATRRQLSAMHPIYRLLDPHFKDTMHINSIYRSILLESDGIFEKILFSGKLSMEISSELYKEWRFIDQGLPADLLKRNMAIRDPDPGNPTGVQLLFQDYPYAEDGLEIWTAIKTWVKDFCSIFYKDDDCVHFDEELQAWWSEIRYVGHQNKSDESGWYQMTTFPDLVEALTTLIWTASALHAAVSSGQYAYSSYPLNRPTICHKFIPSEGTIEFAQLLSDPDKYYLEMLPGKLETALGSALMEVLSCHLSDVLYLGTRSSPDWTDNEEIQQKFSEFGEELKRIEERIAERNRDPNRKNRSGPAKIPYKLLFPDTSSVSPKGGIKGKGIPNSICI